MSWETEDSASKKFELIIVWKLDRFARDRYDSAHYKATLRKNGVKVISATEKISEGSEGILMEAVLEGMAEYYSAEPSEKVVRGLTENAYKCKFNGGTLPLGYTIDSEQYFQIEPLVAPAVLEAFKRYAEGASMSEIAEEMNTKGLRSAFDGKIGVDIVTRMLKNRRYIGEFKYRDIIHPSGIPAIIPDELFDRVQRRMATNKKLRQNTKPKMNICLQPNCVAVNTIALWSARVEQVKPQRYIVITNVLVLKNIVVVIK